MRTEDGSIIHRCLNGEPAAFGILVDKYKEGIYAFAYDKLRNFHDAQDVTQEVFVEAYRSLRSLKRWESFAFWLYRIASTHCRMWMRIQSRRIDRDFIEDQDPRILGKSSLNNYQDKQIGESLQGALGSLSETYREVLMLHYFGGMTIRDIARATGASPSAIGMRLSRARAQLKEEMIAMMDTAIDEQRLPEGFTFRIVEAIKRIKINPMPRVAGLPWGLSLAAGIIVAVLVLNPHLSVPSDMANPAGSPLSAETKVLKTGEIPVDILKVSQIPAIASKQGDGDGGEPQNAFFLAPKQGEGGTWTKKADMPTARWGLSTSVVNGKIYAIGGVNLESEGFGLPTVEEYDPGTDKWTKKDDMPTQRMWLSSSVVNGKIYAIGGYTRPIERAAVEEYDPATNKWTKKADMPTARAWLSTGVVNGKIYAIGGWQNGVVISPSPVEEYDPVADKWTKKPDMPGAAVCELSASVVNERIYVFGGWNGNNLAPNVVLTVREYNPITGTWTEKTDMPTAWIHFSTSVVDGKIYAIGGTTGVEEYDPLTDKWAKKDDRTISREGLSTSAVNGKIYAIGGWDAKAYLSTVEEYDTGLSGESIEPMGKFPTTWGEVRTAFNKESK